jgi:allantoin racemase
MATYLLTYQLATKFACISISKTWTPWFIKIVKESGCYDRMTSMRDLPKALKFPVPKDYYTQEEFEKEVRKIAKRQVEEEGAQALVIICGLMPLLLPPGGIERLSKEFGIIVLNPWDVAVKTAEMFVKLGVSHSKIEYPQMEV